MTGIGLCMRSRNPGLRLRADIMNTQSARRFSVCLEYREGRMDKKKKQKILIQHGIKQVLNGDDRSMLKFALNIRIITNRNVGFKYIARRYAYIKRVLLGEE